MILKGFNKEKQVEEHLKPRILSSLSEIQANELPPEVKSSCDPSELPPYVIFVRGTPEAFARLKKKNSNTLLFISNVGSDLGTLYLGDRVISTNVPAKMEDIGDVSISPELASGSLLVYEDGLWVDKTVDELLDFVPVDYQFIDSLFEEEIVEEEEG